MGKWSEKLHPRAPDGKFVGKGGGGVKAKPTTSAQLDKKAEHAKNTALNQAVGGLAGYGAIGTGGIGLGMGIGAAVSAYQNDTGATMRRARARRAKKNARAKKRR